MTDAEIKEYINNVFEQNYTLLRTTAGHGLTEDVKKSALQQVLYYYEKCKDIATRVTDTEVKLTLSNELSPKETPYAIEGVVDIISENGKNWMYDLKTDSLDHIESNMDRYTAQLNVYAYIYQELRKQDLQGTAIISTVLPIELQDAIAKKDEDKIKKLFAEWQPVFEIKDFSQESVKATIEEFGKTVDKIENNEFTPPPVSRLGEVLGVKKGETKKRYQRTFARRTCGNCDARYSCKSYKEYQKNILKHDDFKDRTYYDVYDTEAEREVAATVNNDLSVMEEEINLEDIRQDGSY